MNKFYITNPKHFATVFGINSYIFQCFEKFRFFNITLFILLQQAVTYFGNFLQLKIEIPPYFPFLEHTTMSLYIIT